MSVILGVWQVGELNEGVTGALLELPGIYRWCGNLEDGEEEEPYERFFSHGISELGSGLILLEA